MHHASHILWQFQQTPENKLILCYETSDTCHTSHAANPENPEALAELALAVKPVAVRSLTAVIITIGPFETTLFMSLFGPIMTWPMCRTMDQDLHNFITCTCDYIT